MKRNPRSREQGQSIVLVALALVPILIFVGLIVDGGYAFSQQRNTQNAADAAADAGAVVLVQNLPFRVNGDPQPKTDQDVRNAIVASATSNGMTSAPTAVYTNIRGEPIGVTVGSLGTAPPPATAYGVRVTGGVAFQTFFSGVAGITGMTASANATAVAGAIQSVCPASSGCSFIPLTFPTELTLCDGTNHQVEFGSGGPYTIADNPTAANEVIIPLCSTADGNVGWLDFDPDNPDCTGGGSRDLACDISTPSQSGFPLPIWVHAVTGNTNSTLVQDALNQYTGPTVGLYEPGQDKIVQIPLYDCIDNNVGQLSPGPPCPTPEVTGTGSRTYYRIIAIAAMILDKAYIQANNPQCNQAPGSPFVGGNGATGCIKGWLTHISTTGAVTEPTAGSKGTVWGVQLIR